MSGGAHDSVRPPPAGIPHSSSIRFPCGAATRWRREQSRGAMGAAVWRNFSNRRPQAGADGEEAAVDGRCEGGPASRGWESVHRTTLATRDEPNRCQVGPTILLNGPRPGAPVPPPSDFPVGHAQGPFIELENFGISRHFLMMDAHKLLMLLVLILSLHVISSNRVDPLPC